MLQQAARATSRPELATAAFTGRGLLFRAAGFSGTQVQLKRGLDFTVALVALAFLWPLMLGIALAVRLDSPGSILIAQERLGKGCRRFQMLKFRSMVRNAGDLLA